MTHDAATRHQQALDPNALTARSAKAEVRNPVLALPSVARLRALSPEARLALQDILLDIQSDARLRAEKSWRSRKPQAARRRRFR